MVFAGPFQLEWTVRHVRIPKRRACGTQGCSARGLAGTHGAGRAGMGGGKLKSNSETQSNVCDDAELGGAAYGRAV